ncbi:MAG: hypothetical protein SO096_04210, partial [Prevotella sp.]|nr:hypothetical protein [Prevotella sp.]
LKRRMVGTGMLALAHHSPWTPCAPQPTSLLGNGRWAGRLARQPHTIVMIIFSKPNFYNRP